MAPLLLLVAVGSTPLELRAAIHVHTTFSDGKHSIQEVAEMARKAGVDAVVLSDHFMDEVSFGPPRLGRGLSLTERVPSLTPRQLPSYLEAAREAEKRTGVLVLPGVELTPYYFWEGSLFRGTLTLRSGDRHLLVVFPEGKDPRELLRGLANVASPAGRRFGLGSIVLLWPLVPFVWGGYRLLVPRRRSIRLRHFLVRTRRRSILALLAFGLSIVVLVRSWPFTVPRFSPYAGEVGLAPYRYAVDEAAGMGALTFWAHPEASVRYRHPRYPVTYRSDAYPELVSRIDGADGFASLFEGYRVAAAPGGPWDEALMAYVRGSRRRPVWTLGEISLHEEGEAGGKHIGQVESVLRVHDRSRAAVLEALASGSVYAVRHGEGSRLRLDRFVVDSGSSEARAGERLESVGTPSIEARLRREGASEAPVTIRVIRDGVVVRTETREVPEEPVDFAWVDSTSTGQVSYYRLVVEGKYPEMILSNPVFVAPEGDPP